MTKPKTRISAKVRDAVRLMVEEGLNRAQASERAGLKDNSLYVALRRPEVCAFRTEIMEALRTSAASRTIAKAEMLMDDAESEHVQADMTKWLAGIVGIIPVQRSENLHIHATTTPGLIINLVQPQAPPRMIIDVEASAHAVSLDCNGRPLPIPVPHPSQRAK